jgi:hypothetical protein
MIELSVIDRADQQFGIVLNGKRVSMRLRFNTTTRRWSYDLSLDDVWIIQGKRIVSMVDLFRSLPHLDIGHLYAYPATVGASPDRKSLPGRLVRLYHATSAEVDAVKAAGP